MAEYYPLLRLLHITCAALSVGGFALRSALLLAGSSLYRRPWVRRITDTVDALLLSAAVGLMVTTGQYPFVTPWLTAKVTAVVGYIGLGVLVFRRAKGRSQQVAGVLAALAIVAYILSVAISRNPCGLFAALCG